MARDIFDIETNGLLDELDRVHSLVIKDADTGEGWSCHDQGWHAYKSARGFENHSVEEGLRRLQDADEIIGHNIIKFDIEAIQIVYPWFKPKGKVTDTLVISKLIWTNLKDRDFRFRAKHPEFPGQLIGRHGLEAWGWRLGMHKGDYAKEMKAKGLDPWAEWNPSMQDYCEQDVDVTEALVRLIESKQYSQRAIDLEMEFQQIIWLQEKYGFPFNVDHAQELYATLSKRRAELEQELRRVFRHWWAFAGTQRPKRSMRRFIENPNGKPHWRTSSETITDPESGRKRKKKVQVRGYYEEVTEGVPFCKIKLTEFNPGSRDHIADRLTKLRGWKPKLFGKDGKPTVDDEVLSALQYPEAKLLTEYLMVQKRIGQLAEGKEACLRHVQPDGRIHGQVNTGGAVTGRCTHSKPNVAQTPAVGVPYGREFRECYHAPVGWVLVGADASGLELRCLAHYIARWDGGAYADVILNGDIHTMNQQAAGLPTRNNAKTFIYAFLYGAGDAKIGSIIGKGAKAGKQLKSQFLAKTPALAKLVKGVKGAVMSKGYLRGLDGRLLHIRSDHAALNTLLQSAGALVMKQALINLYRSLSSKGLRHGDDYAFVANVHDEFQILVRPQYVDLVMEESVNAIRKAGEDFEFRCPLDGEAKQGRTWADTH